MYYVNKYWQNNIKDKNTKCQMKVVKADAYQSAI